MFFCSMANQDINNRQSVNQRVRESDTFVENQKIKRIRESENQRIRKSSTAQLGIMWSITGGCA